MAGFAWDDLQYFLAVARTGQLSSAARRLRSNHVTVSRRIDRLEQALSMRLFERSPRGYTLTAIGERLVAHAEAMEASAEGLHETLSGERAAPRGVVRLSTPEGFGSFFLSPRLPDFAARNPGLLIEFMTLQQILSLSRREADITISLHPPSSGPYRIERIARYRLLVYAARRYLDRHPPLRTREDVMAHPLIGYIDDMIFSPGLDYIRDILPGTRASYQSSSIIVQLSAGLAGYGITILPYFIGSTYPELVPVLPQQLFIEREYWMSCHEQLADAPRIRVLQDYLRQTARDHDTAFMARAIIPD
ncbi:LysR family transcriptional regulator [Aureimonas frigidaquae]|uniref:LysR family transcriptional regulator n=1 Tax=Aureimonas frigidaquae TaxID=424757 RepID=A0A0P0Z1P1_9HYPH|nr:LysR family transcriptional regulator [Aureimonas frigidaquae]BAT27935.1 LysR family transcriptional regulator [Aureimonas frigidaquae]